MQARPLWAILLLCLSIDQSAAVAQKSSAQRTVAVVVADAHFEPAQPVPTVRVSLGYLDGSVLVTEARDVTNPKGQAWLDVSENAAQRGDLRIQITGANNLVIYQPADGQLTALPPTLSVSMLPKGSPALLGPAQIEAMLHRTLLQVSSLQNQVNGLKREAQNQKPDPGPELAEWAQAMGFPAAQVDQQVQQWAQQIQRDSAQATFEQKALAEFALKHYANAAQLFDQAARSNRNSIDATEAQETALQKALLEKVRDQLHQLVNNSQQSASASQLNLQYRQATQTLDGAETITAAEYKKHPDDKGFHELWLQALLSVANARTKEGEVAPADQSLGLLAQSANEFQTLAREYTALADRQDIALAQNGLGVALLDEGSRSSGDRAITLFDQATQAYQNALGTRTKADLPRDWALIEVNLGNLFSEEAQRISGERATAFFGKAIEAYRKAQEVLTKADLPQDWARTENNLGRVLLAEGERSGGDNAVVLIDEAAQAYQKTLEVFTQADLPESWAMAQSNLGTVFLDEGMRSSGDKATALLVRAVQAFQNALKVRNKADLPQVWAATQYNLGIVLIVEGERTRGDKGAALFDLAVQAFQKALEVRTKAELPQDWGMTEDQLGIALADEGTRASGDKAAALFDQSVQAHRNALETWTKADDPQDWARTEINLGNALQEEGLCISGDKAMALFDQAVQCYQNALEVFTKADLPFSWAMVEGNLGSVLENAGARASGDKAAALFDQAIQAFQNSLQVFTKAGQPESWVNMQMSLMELDLWAGRSTACLQQAAVLAGDTVPPSGVAVRDAMKLACQWGAGGRGAAAATETAIASKPPVFENGYWDFTGTISFLTTAPAFEKGRASWVALFTSLQNGDSAGMTAALHQLEPLLQK